MKLSRILLVFIILIGFLVRQYRIDNAIADWHSWRQADTASVARNFYQDGFNPFIPKYDDMSPVSDSGVFNLARYRFVEFPIYNSLVYFAYLITGGVNVKIAREVTVLISLGSIIFLYLLTKRYFSEATAILASLLFAILPYNIYYSRTVLPDPLQVFFCLGMVYFIDRWIYEDKRWIYVFGLIFSICAFLIKPTSAFYLLPLVYSYYRKEGSFLPIPPRYFKLAIFSVLPIIAWRLWIGQHPEGIPSSSWLLNGNGIRFRPAFWRWIINDRFGREILTVPGTALFVLGLIIKPRGKESYFLHLLALGAFLYLSVFATGNVQHDYYQIFIVPSLVIFLARGFLLCWERVPNFLARVWTIPFAILFLTLTIYFGWNEVKGLYQINNDSIVKAGDEANRILPKDAIVVANYYGDTAFLYQTNRHGFPTIYGSIPDMVKNYGVSYFISVKKDADTLWAMKAYSVLEDNQSFTIVDLTKPNTALISNHPKP